MKKILWLGIVFLTLIGCESKQRYTRDSPEIDTVKRLLENYLTRNWEKYKSNFAENAKIFINVTESNPATVQELIAQQKMEIEGLSSYSFDKDKQTLEMVLDDQGRTWVKYWGVWKGTLAANNQTFEIPIHITFQFMNGKIIKEFGYWDNSKITSAVMLLQSAGGVRPSDNVNR